MVSDFFEWSRYCGTPEFSGFFFASGILASRTFVIYRTGTEDTMDRNEACHEICHETYMKRALELAQTAMGRTSPNPMVGCVVVKNGSIVAEGCHEKFGAFHAERNALTKCEIGRASCRERV